MYVAHCIRLLSCIRSLIWTCIFVFIPLWISIWIYNHHAFWSNETAWSYLRLSTLSCSAPNGCVDFNLTCDANGKIILFGINHTLYRGMKVFHLDENRIVAVHQFIERFNLKSDIQSTKVLVLMELFRKNTNEIYVWTNDSLSYSILTSLLNVHTLLSYKYWPALLDETQKLPVFPTRLGERQFMEQLDKHENSTTFNQTKRLTVSIAMDMSMIDDAYDNKFEYYNMEGNVQLIRKSRNSLSLFNDSICFSSEKIISKFDLVDACLSTNDIVRHNEFYPFRDLLILPQNFVNLSEVSMSNGLLSTSENVTSTTTTASNLMLNSSTTSTTTPQILSPEEITAQTEVNNVANQISQLTGLNDQRLLQAESLVQSLPKSSSIRASLLQTLDSIKAQLAQSAASSTTTSTVSTTNTTSQHNFNETVGVTGEPLNYTGTTVEKLLPTSRPRLETTGKSVIHVLNTTMGNYAHQFLSLSNV